MSVAEIVSRRAFDPTTDPEALARAHERLRLLSDADPERELYQALTALRPCAAEIRGPSGSGKSSCIMRVVGDVARLGEHETLILRAGDASEILESPASFAYYLIDVIRAQGFRFSHEVQDRLRDVGADETTVTDAAVTHSAGADVDAKVIRGRYQASLRRAYDARKYGQTPARARGELEEIIALIRDEGARPVVVIDDTDKFADPVRDEVDADGVDKLFGNGIPLLGELRLDFVVAVHPRFAGVGRYDAVAQKHLSTRVEIPWLSLTREPIRAVLAKHMRASGLNDDLDALITDVALAALWGAYSGQRDLRYTLDIAQRAARHADDRRSALIDAEDIDAALRDRAA